MRICETSLEAYAAKYENTILLLPLFDGRLLVNPCGRAREELESMHQHQGKWPETDGTLGDV